MGDAVGFLALYVVYIAVVVVGRYINNKHRADTHQTQSILSNDELSEEQEEEEAGAGQLSRHPTLTGNPPEIQLVRRQAANPVFIRVCVPGAGVPRLHLYRGEPLPAGSRPQPRGQGAVARGGAAGQGIHPAQGGYLATVYSIYTVIVSTVSTLSMSRYQWTSCSV